ncbi:MAG: helix-turn-helix domain-containing protein [Prevotella sp.]|nr:helix-turn-helix domain-containing protein [Prevotella sp.]
MTQLAISQPRYKIIDFARFNDNVTQVKRIVRDNQGMMWFAANDGLYRYDGYDFRCFKSRSGDGINMPSNNISYMYCSSEGSIWCIISKRAFLFDTHSYRYVDVLQQFEEQQHRTYRINKLRALPCGVTWLFTDDGKIIAVNDANPTGSVRLMSDYPVEGNITAVCDRQQRSWVLTDSHTLLCKGSSLRRFDQTFRSIIASEKRVWLLSADGRLSYYDEPSGLLRPLGRPAARIDGMSALADGRLALFTTQGLLLMSADGRQLRPTAATWPVSKVMDDGNGHLWILAADGTLTMSDMQCSEVSHIAGFQSHKCNVMRDNHGSVWIFSEKGEAYYSDSSHPEVLVRYDEARLEGDINNTISDGQGGYWFIHGGRAYRLTFELSHYSYLPLHTAGEVRCLATDRHGRLLVATRADEALTVFSPDGQRLGWLTADGRISSSYTPFGASIYSSLLTADGTLWLGSKRNGIFRLRPRTDGSFSISHYTHSPDRPSLSNDEVYSFAADSRGRLWIGTHKGGICCITDMRADEPRFATLGSGLPANGELGASSVRSLLITPEGQLLAGTYSGLFVADVSGKSLASIHFRAHQRQAHRASSLCSNSVTGLCLLPGGRLFVATGDSGIDELAAGSIGDSLLHFRHYNTTNGFPIDVAQSVSAFGGSLWITAPNRLVQLTTGNTDEPGTGTFLMQQNPRFASCQPTHLGQGHWVFGTASGAMLVSLDVLKQGTFVPPLIVTGVSRENSAIDFAAATSDTIRLSPQERDLTIWFSALDYENTELVSYAYRMGSDKPWIYIGQNHSITFSQMQPGTHHITLRSTDSDGGWCDNARTVTIVVVPTFWQTPWALLLIVLTIAAIAATVAYTIIYIRRINRKQHETMEAYLALLSTASQPQPAGDSSPAETTAPAAATAPPEASPAPLSTKEDEEVMRRLMAFIDEQLGNSDVTIDDMAQAVAVSRSGLHRKVKHLLGTSPMEFLREARIRRAAQMLQSTDKSVSEIAYLCGFTDPKYFSKCFKTSTGKTPTEYKNA